MPIHIFALLVSAIPAFAAAAPAPALVSFAFQARVSDSSRSRETWVVAPTRAAAFRETSRVAHEDVQVELTPRASDGDYILFAYRIQKSEAGRWVQLSAGDLKARNGRRTELLVGGGAASGQLVQLAIHAQSGEPPQGSIGGSRTLQRRTGTRARFQRL